LDNYINCTSSEIKAEKFGNCSKEENKKILINTGRKTAAAYWEI
jgi:hypothetical protein